MGGEGLVVAGWILEEPLGAGGFGEVWKARRRHLDHHRALKLMRIVGETVFESWRHEIDRLEALSHPNIVRFYDADIVSEGPYRNHAWIATELCERSLADELRRRQTPVLVESECERLADEMLAALSAARSGDCVHRDVKPANILRHASGGWKLADFGTARLVPPGASHPETRVIGTLPYMSPDAHHGRQDHAADLYALGVTIHESLCARRLHPRPAEMTDSEYVRFLLDTPPVIDGALSRPWRTVIEVLIGRHGALNADQVAGWFHETSGNQPPSAVGIVFVGESAVEPPNTMPTEQASPAAAETAPETSTTIPGRTHDGVGDGEAADGEEPLVGQATAGSATGAPDAGSQAARAPYRVVTGVLGRLRRHRIAVALAVMALATSAVYWRQADREPTEPNDGGPRSEEAGGATTADDAGTTTSAQETPRTVRLAIIDAGDIRACGIRLDETAVCWGDDSYVEAASAVSSPGGRFEAVSTGLWHVCGLRPDRTVACWGETGDVPGGRFESVSAGASFTCGMRTDRTVVCWGVPDLGQLTVPDDGQLTVPEGQFESVSAGGAHACGVRVDGTVTCWGNDVSGRASPPEGRFASVSAGGTFTCGVKADRTVGCWGDHTQGQEPAGQFQLVDAGSTHACGVRVDGTVACWGNDLYGATSSPDGQFETVSAGDLFSCAVRANQTVTCWGDDDQGQASPPPT